MAEYIEREALMDVMCAETCHISSAPSEPCNVCHIASVIAAIPAADVVEAVDSTSENGR